MLGGDPLTTKVSCDPLFFGGGGGGGTDSVALGKLLGQLCDQSLASPTSWTLAKVPGWRWEKNLSKGGGGGGGGFCSEKHRGHTQGVCPCGCGLQLVN